MSFNKQASLAVQDYNSSRCDRCVLNFISSCLQHDSDGNPSCAVLQPILAQVKQVLERGGVVCIDTESQVQFINQRAIEFFSRYFAWSIKSCTLPDVINRWFKCQITQKANDSELSFTLASLQVEQGNQQLIIHLSQNLTPKCYVLLLEEQEISALTIDALELLGLTKREAEVLFWVIKDKSNSGIARVLDCCEGTVRKHLEKIYRKLGAQTRIGAVMLSLEKLGLLNRGFVSKTS